jgi:3-mercaptopyruvate sulfurtransferase SseA
MMLGHGAVSVLEGGYEAWSAAGCELPDGL